MLFGRVQHSLHLLAGKLLFLLEAQ